MDRQCFVKCYADGKFEVRCLIPLFFSVPAVGKQLDSLPGGGQCIAKQYVQFTHSCTVTNYMPSVDHCCCAYDQKVLCCRYHQDWDHFRCSQADDTIETL